MAMTEFSILRELSNDAQWPRGLKVVCFLHLRRDVIPFLHALRSSGVDAADLYITGPTYSVDAEVVEEIGETFNCFFDLAAEEVGPEEHARQTTQAMFRSLEEGLSPEDAFIIIEDGGHAVAELHENFPGLIDRCVGSVEQTSRGAQRARKLEASDQLEIPVLAIPDCILKNAEGGPIGTAVRWTLEEILMRNGDQLAGKTIGVIGYGTIGRRIALALKNMCTVHMVDLDSKKYLIAEYEGVAPSTLVGIAASCHVIIGVTGATSINSTILDNCMNGAYLVSASSLKVEIDMAWLEANATLEGQTGLLDNYRYNDGRLLRLVYEGQPVNFALGHSLPAQWVDLVYSLMYSAGFTLIGGGVSRGVSGCGAEEDAIADLYVRHYQNLP